MKSNAIVLPCRFNYSEWLGCTRRALRADRKAKNLERIFLVCNYCSALKSPKTAKVIFGKAWRRQAEIWKCLAKELRVRQTRPREAGPLFAIFGRVDARCRR